MNYRVTFDEAVPGRKDVELNVEAPEAVMAEAEDTSFELLTPERCDDDIYMHMHMQCFMCICIGSSSSQQSLITS